MEMAGYILSVFIGITLGLIGGGGSILTVPILIYFFGVRAEMATSYSLIIVGLTAGIGAFKNYRNGYLNLQSAVIFGVPSIVSLLLTRKFLLTAIPDNLTNFGNFVLTKDLLIILLFAILMVAASLSMIRSKTPDAETPGVSPAKLASLGFGVGVVTGFLGAGGGFLIIPALVFVAGLSMKKAVGTSLFIITANSLIGAVGDIVNGVQLNYVFLATIAALAFAGMFFGMSLSNKMDGKKLKPLFGWFVLVMGMFIIVKELLFK